MSFTIQQRRDYARSWTFVNPILAAGELAIEQDTGLAKMGDGQTGWNNLSYFQPAGPQVAQTASFALPTNNTYTDAWQHTVTQQQTSGLRPFGLTYGSQTYGSAPPVRGPAFWMGYNTRAFLAGGGFGTTGHGGAVMSCFADAGDSNNGSGGHGIEMNPAAFITPDGSKTTSAFQMVAFDDNTNTVNTSIRCGNGNSNGTYSAIVLSNGDSSKLYMGMGPSYSDQVKVFRPFNVTFDASALGTIFTMANTGATGSGTVLLDYNASGTNTTGVGQFVFQNHAANKWAMGYSSALSNWWYVQDMVNSRFPFRIAPGASAAATIATIDAQLVVTGAVQPGNNTAAGGHIYSGSGAPTLSAVSGDCYLRTDTPTTTNQRLYVCTGTTNWTGIL